MAFRKWRKVRLRGNVDYVREHAEPQSWHLGINFQTETDHETV